jgi:hypothetical protein
MITRKRVWYVVDEHLSAYAPEKGEEKDRDLD